jgi:hypothetical protein
MHFVQHQTPEAKSVTVSRTGKAIAARYAQAHQDAKALFALNLVNGAPIPPMSRRKAAKTLGVSRYRIALAALATADERECVQLKRLRLRDVRRAHAKRVEMSDAEIVDFINRADPGRILDILDAMTAPAPQLMAAE